MARTSLLLLEREKTSKSKRLAKNEQHILDDAVRERKINQEHYRKIVEQQWINKSEENISRRAQLAERDRIADERLRKEKWVRLKAKARSAMKYEIVKIEKKRREDRMAKKEADERRAHRIVKRRMEVERKQQAEEKRKLKELEHRQKEREVELAEIATKTAASTSALLLSSPASTFSPPRATKKSLRASRLSLDDYAMSQLQKEAQKKMQAISEKKLEDERLIRALRESLATSQLHEKEQKMRRDERRKSRRRSAFVGGDDGARSDSDEEEDEDEDEDGYESEEDQILKTEFNHYYDSQLMLLGTWEEVQELQHAKVKADKDRYRLFQIVKRNDVEALVALIESYQSERSQLLVANEQDETGMSPLHYCAKFGYHEMLDYILDLGADVNTKDASGSAPIHYACEHNHDYIIGRLYRVHADLSAVNVDGKLCWETSKRQKYIQEMIFSQTFPPEHPPSTHIMPDDGADVNGFDVAVSVEKKDGDGTGTNNADKTADAEHANEKGNEHEHGTDAGIDADIDGDEDDDAGVNMTSENESGATGDSAA